MIFSNIAWGIFFLGQGQEIQVMNGAFFIECNLITDDGDVYGSESKVPEVKHVVDFLFEVLSQNQPFRKGFPQILWIDGSENEMNQLVGVRVFSQ